MTSETGTKTSSDPKITPNGQHDKTAATASTDGQHDGTDPGTGDGQHDGTGGDGEVGTEGQHD